MASTVFGPPLRLISSAMKACVPFSQPSAEGARINPAIRTPRNPIIAFFILLLLSSIFAVKIARPEKRDVKNS